jgi:integrase
MRGHIYKRGDSWAVSIYLGRDASTGKKRRHFRSFPTKKVAQEYLASSIVVLHAGGQLPTADRRMCVDAFLQKWLESERVRALAPTTRRIYTYGVAHLTVGLGRVPLPMLDAMTIDTFFGTLRQRGLSGATRHQIYRTLKTALRAARRWKLLDENPVADVTAPQVPHRQPTIWDIEQIHLFLGAARGTTYYRLFYLLVCSGIRPGEALALRWIDVDWLLGTITVRQKFYRLGKKQVWGDTKTHRQATTVSIEEPMVAELRELQREQQQDRARWGEDYRDHGLVFCQANGEPLHEENIAGRAFKAIIAKAGLPDIRLYDLRHCHATLLANAKVPIHVVQHRLGHRKPATTLQYYTHALPDADRAASDTFRRLLGRDKEKTYER